MAEGWRRAHQSLILLALLPCVSLVLSAALGGCAAPQKPGLPTDPYGQLKRRYPPAFYLMGIGEAPLTQAAATTPRMAEVMARQAAEAMAKAEIARSIRVTIREQITDIVRETVGKESSAESELTVVAESKTEELIEGVEVVQSSPDEARGVYAAVVVMDREQAIKRLTSRAEQAYGRAGDLTRQAEAVKARDPAKARQLLTEAREATLHGLAFESERPALAGPSLREMPGTIPPISNRPDRAALQAALASSSSAQTPPLSGSPAPSVPQPSPQRPAQPAPPSEQEPLPPAAWVEGEGDAPFGGDVSFEEAKARARDAARRDAVEKAVGTYLKGSSVVYNYQLVEDLISTATRGIIEEEQVLEEKTEEMRKGGQVTGLLFHTRVKAKVRLDRVERKGDYAVTASLNRTVFQEGEEAQIRVRPSQDSFVYIFTVSQDEKVWVLLPNSLVPDHFVSAGEEFTFPNETLRTRGLRLRVAPPPGLKRATEKIKVIAARKQLGFIKGKVPEGVFSLYEGKETRMITDLLKELATLDGDDWAEATLPYEVRK